MSIKYSFVLPTYNRLSLLKETLQSLLEQNFDKNTYEIVVIDDNSKDGTEAYITKLIYTTNISVVYHKNKINQGVGYNRNYGIKIANGEYIIQVEDDAKYPKDYLLEINKRIEKNTEINWGTLIILPRKTRNFHEGILPKLVEFRRESITDLTKTGKRRIIGGWIFKKDLIENLGGYKPLKIGEDTELVKRINQAGYRSFAIFSTFWWHHEPSSFCKFFKRMYMQGFYYKEYKEVFKPEITLLAKIFRIFLILVPIISIILTISVSIYRIFIIPLGFFLLTIMNQETRSMYPLIIQSKYKWLIFFVFVYYLCEIYGILTGRIMRSFKEKQTFIY